MTACAYISPGGIPVLIADTVVTFSKLDPTVDNLKNRKELTKILPGLSPQAFDLKVFQQTRLVRKIYILNDGAAVAIAGDMPQVGDYLEVASGLIDEFMKYARPMRKLGDYANQVNVDAGENVIEVLGACITELAGVKEINAMTCRPAKELSVFSKTAVIGSGSSELGTLLRRFNDQLADNGRRPETDEASYELIRGTVSACNSGILFKDRALAQASNNSWGGFLEYAYYNIAESKWSRGPKSVHMIFHLADDPVTGIELNLDLKIIAYDPGDKHGCVLSVTLDFDEGASLHTWLLEDLLNGNSEDNAKMYLDKDFWKKWECENATMTIVPPEGDNSLQLIHKSIERSQVNEITFDINDESVNVGISVKLEKELLEIACSTWAIGDQER